MRRWAKLASGLALLGLGLTATLSFHRRGPPPQLERPLFSQPTRIYARPLPAAAFDRFDTATRSLPAGQRGRPLLTVLPELIAIGAVYDRPAIDREPVPLHRIPRPCVDAVLQVEDQRFFDHAGLDLRRVAGAAVANLRARRIVEGGSTVTQQLVRNLFLTRERSLDRKLREAALALRLERSTSKPEILEAYLNEIYLGQRGAVAVHGLGAAARHWFGRDVSSLGLAECALLAGLIRGPNLYTPWRSPARALSRRNLVLTLLRDADRIGREDYERALRVPLPTASHPQPESGWFVDRVRRELRQRYSRAELSRGGLRVVTTLDRRLQAAAEQALGQGLAALEAEHPTLLRTDHPVEGAVVVLDPRRGDVLALVGGRDYRRSQFNRALEARRQPGSVFKPVVALAALEPSEARAPVARLETPLLDAPVRIVRPDGVWRPSNYDRRFRGRVTLQEALERSLNVPFVQLGRRVGPEGIAATAKRLGIESPLEVVPALALGSSEVTLLEMTRAYAVLASEGVRAEARTIQLVIDPVAGRVVAEPVTRWRAVDAVASRLVTRALRGAVERGTGRSLRRLGVTEPVAGKTGTTSDFRDAWFVGYTPGIVVGVWVGFDDGRGIGLPGSRAALPIFARFLRVAQGETPLPGDAELPSGNPVDPVQESESDLWRTLHPRFHPETNPDSGNRAPEGESTADGRPPRVLRTRSR